jgi:hypothetical protein
VLLALWFFTSRDDATTSGPRVAAPGVAWSGAPPHAADVARGNVVLVPADASAAAAAKALARAVGGTPTAELRAAGQAVLVDRPADAPPAGAVVAYAAGRRLGVAAAADPRLRAFVEYWLGRAAG